ncbi:DNA repair protein RecN [Kineobactrum sediminis]|uniref:DNA repair protein RecN n=1 Tax=Kineobactrum sediminis TaxID=1905677 RepID=A0A2N5XZW9_9GAMM|nr:DNA repair protein RecN [Kineobactrum sediminis]PLW81702.1 DNA repair protein RecN [Kineobactrum sediminis]
MLTHISISQYTIVDTLDMEFRDGMTVITGETGAGKSIMLDALGLCLGDRADPKAIRHGSDRAEVTACFDISGNPAAAAWLRTRDLLCGEDCLLRRVVTSEGRSRAYINGSASTLQDCSELGELLIDIHSQHAHQSLLRKAFQRNMLDTFAGHQTLARGLEQTASDWLRAKRELALLTSARDEQTARAQLLAYQVDELEQLSLQAGELDELEQDQQQLANAEDILRGAHQALEICEQQAGGARQALNLIKGEAHSTRTADNARELLESASIQLDEARSEIQRYIDSVEIDPQRLADVEKRLEHIHDIARKHRIKPHQLPELASDLQAELEGLAQGDQRIGELEQTLASLALHYAEEAASLSKKRTKAAKSLITKAGEVLKTLAMGECCFEIALLPRETAEPHPQGAEDVEFLISTNPGAPPQPLAKIASGGELSRISLAIQVVTASDGTLPSMVFDEVDVGIGGAVAEVVGRLLRALAKDTQVLCVTHLAQVAAQGHQHLQVTKTSDKHAAFTRMYTLEEQERTREIARMLGGVKITEQSLAHAREMLEDAAA